jgi:hypothetical protein
VTDIYSAQFLIVFALGLLATGAISGVLAGLLGVGGGIVIVPVLFLLAGFLGLPAELAMPMAVGTSLATIIPTSISSARSHRKRGSVDAQLLKSWAPAVFVGALIGGVLASVVSGAFLTVLFGVVALLVAINLALPRTVVLAEDLPKGGAARTAVPTAIGILSACDCGACRVRFHLGGVGRGRTSAVLIGLCQRTRGGFDLYHECFHRPYGVTVGAFFGCARVEACLCTVFVCDVAADVVAGVWLRVFFKEFRDENGSDRAWVYGIRNGSVAFAGGP